MPLQNLTLVFKVGQLVRHNGHGVGTIVALNERPKNSYLMKKDGLLIAAKLLAMSGESAVNLLYDGDRYPYVVKFNDGYKDVYSESDLTEGDQT